MTNEAFARVKIDAPLAAQGWDVLDTNAVRFEAQRDILSQHSVLGNPFRLSFVEALRQVQCEGFKFDGAGSIGLHAACALAADRALRRAQLYAHAIRKKFSHISTTTRRAINWES